MVKACIVNLKRRGRIYKVFSGCDKGGSYLVPIFGLYRDEAILLLHQVKSNLALSDSCNVFIFCKEDRVIQSFHFYGGDENI